MFPNIHDDEDFDAQYYDSGIECPELTYVLPAEAQGMEELHGGIEEGYPSNAL